MPAVTVALAERGPDCDHSVADAEVSRCAQRRRREHGAPHRQHRDVVDRAPAHDPCRVALAVGIDHRQGAVGGRFRDHVVVRDNVALTIQDESRTSGALAILAELRPHLDRARKEFLGHGSDGGVVGLQGRWDGRQRIRPGHGGLRAQHPGGDIGAERAAQRAQNQRGHGHQRPDPTGDPCAARRGPGLRPRAGPRCRCRGLGPDRRFLDERVLVGVRRLRHRGRSRLSGSLRLRHQIGRRRRGGVGEDRSGRRSRRSWVAGRGTRVVGHRPISAHPRVMASIRRALFPACTRRGPDQSRSLGSADRPEEVVSTSDLLGRQACIGDRPGRLQAS